MRNLRVTYDQQKSFHLNKYVGPPFFHPMRVEHLLLTKKLSHWVKSPFFTLKSEKTLEILQGSVNTSYIKNIYVDGQKINKENSGC